MTLAKSLLLGSAAALVAAVSAQAADLPYKKAAPIEYVRICDSHGAGFFYIPGTDTCLKIGGNVEFDYQVMSAKKSIGGYKATHTLGTITNGKLYNANGVFVRGRLQLDARNTTAWGTLRTFVSVQIDHKTGDAAAAATPGASTDVASVDKAFIQWAGFTAGRYQSVFDFYADNWNHYDLDDSDASINGLAYTATFGDFLATLSLEDRADRLGSTSAGTTTIGGLAQTAIVQGDMVPDIVGQLNYSQGWGQVQLTGAAHQQNTSLVTAAPLGTSANASKSDWGYAGQLGVEINLPMLAAGDQLWLEGAYTDGALLYNQITGGRNVNGNGLLQTDYDTIWTGTTATGFTIKSPTSWSALAAFQHYFTPSIIGRLSGTYVEVSYPAGSALSALTSNFNRLKVAGQLVWQPIKYFDIGVEVLYVRTDQQYPIALPAAAKSTINSFESTLHVERDF